MGLPWPKVLPLVLMFMRIRRRARSHLSRFEILFVAPPQMGAGPLGPLPSTALCEDALLKYCSKHSSQFAGINKQVAAALPMQATGPLHNLQAGDFIQSKEPSQEALESQLLARPLPDSPRHPERCERR